MKYPIGTMSVGDILGRGIKLLFARFPLFYAIMLIVELPVLILQLALPALMVSGIGALLLLIPTVILQAIGTGAMIRVVMQEYLDRPITFGEVFRFALSRFGALLGTSILAGLLIGLGTLACIIPGIYFSIVYCMASQTVIVEDRAGMDALNRSKSLVEGYFGRVFVILFVLGLCTGILQAVVSAGVALALPYQVTTVLSSEPFGTTRLSNYPNYAINTVLTAIVQIVFQAFMAICTTLLYFDLRNRKESFNLELEADKISAWTERFHPQPHATSSDIQQPDAGIQPPGKAPEPPSTGIQPANPDARAE